MCIEVEKDNYSSAPSAYREQQMVSLLWVSAHSLRQGTQLFPPRNRKKTMDFAIQPSQGDGTAIARQRYSHRKETIKNNQKRSPLSTISMNSFHHYKAINGLYSYSLR